MRLPPVGEKPGRGASQRTLTELRKQLTDSFHLFADVYAETPLVAIDMNILFDIQDSRNDEARTLQTLADRSAELNLCVPCTVLDEIDEIDDKKLRQRRRDCAGVRPTARRSRIVDSTVAEITAFLNDQSLRVPPNFDLLRRGACAKASTFVTRDGTHLTKLNDAMHERYGLRVARSTSSRFRSTCRSGLVRSGFARRDGDNRAKGFKRLLSGIVQSFLRNDRGETKRRFGSPSMRPCPRP